MLGSQGGMLTQKEDVQEAAARALVQRRSIYIYLVGPVLSKELSFQANTDGIAVSVIKQEKEYQLV